MLPCFITLYFCITSHLAPLIIRDGIASISQQFGSYECRTEKNKHKHSSESLTRKNLTMKLSKVLHFRVCICMYSTKNSRNISKYSITIFYCNSNNKNNYTVNAILDLFAHSWKLEVGWRVKRYPLNMYSSSLSTVTKVEYLLQNWPFCYSKFQEFFTSTFLGKHVRFWVGRKKYRFILEAT